MTQCSGGKGVANDVKSHTWASDEIESDGGTSLRGATVRRGRQGEAEEEATCGVRRDGIWRTSKVPSCGVGLVQAKKEGCGMEEAVRAMLRGVDGCRQERRVRKGIRLVEKGGSCSDVVIELV